MGANLDQTSILGNLKQTYAADLEDNRPLWAVLQERLDPNRDGIEMGDKLNIPVLLTHQAGETYDTAGGTTTLRAPISMQISDAQTDQFEITQPVRIPFGIISKIEQSKKARFADKARLMVLAGQTGAKRSLELSLLFGSAGLGQVGVAAAVTGAGPYAVVLTPTAGTWSDGLWGAIENSPIDIYSALSAGTKRNASAGDVTVQSVDFVGKTITLASATQADLTAIVVGDFFFPASAYGKQMLGLMYFMRVASTAGQTIMNLSTNFAMWRTKKVTINGPITFGKLLSGITPAIAHGAEGQLSVYANSRNCADLHKDFLSTRRLDASYSEAKLKNGTRAITYVFHKLTLELISHDFMMDGDVVVLPEENWFRAGSDPDPTMTLGGKELSVMSSVSNSFEFRWFSASAIIPNCMATSVYFTGITPNAS